MNTTNFSEETIDENKTEYKTIYEQIATHFEKEACSYISDTAIQQTLESEKRLFQTAEVKQIPCKAFIGNNSARYCKALLRRNQPFFALYSLSSFLMEYGYYLFFWVFAKCLYTFLVSNKKDLWESPVSLSFSLFVIIGIILFFQIPQAYTRNYLLACSKPERKNGHPFYQIPPSVFAIFIRFLLLVLLVVTGFFLTENAKNGLVSLTVLEAFLFFVGTFLFAGLHNVIYSSYISDFLNVMITMVSPHKKKNLNDVCDTYFSLYQKRTDEKTFKNLKASLKSRRIYLFLGFLIFFLLFFTVLIKSDISHLSLHEILFMVGNICLSIILLWSYITCGQLLKRIKDITFTP